MTAKNRFLDFLHWVQQAAGRDVTFISYLEVRRIFNAVANELMQGQEDEGSPNNRDLEELKKLVGQEFLLHIAFEDRPDCNLCRSVTGDVADTKLAALLRRKEQVNPGGEITCGMVLELASQIGIGLFDLLRAAQDRPIIPRLSLKLTPESLTEGQTLTAEATLKDGNGELMQDKPLSLQFRNVGLLLSAEGHDRREH